MSEVAPRSGRAPILQVSELCTEFATDYGTVRAVDDVTFELSKGEILGIVGESGCGKSVTSLSIMGLLPAPVGRVVSGSIEFDGVELTKLPEVERRRLRGRRMAMVFQDPMSSLNPYLRVNEQLVETMVLHLGLKASAATDRAVAMLERVGIPDARRRIRDYPHQLSGGMRQRVMLAMAMLCDPDLLILDEPTTALDVTIQAQILELLLDLKEERDLAAIFITHDLGVVAQICDRVIVMYAGRIVEQASTLELFKSPSHPYTRALLQSAPGLRRKSERLASIEGLPPRLDRPFLECSFAPRCRFASDVCRAVEPRLVAVRGVAVGGVASSGGPHFSRCIHQPEELDALAS